MSRPAATKQQWTAVVDGSFKTVNGMRNVATIYYSGYTVEDLEGFKTVNGMRNVATGNEIEITAEELNKRFKTVNGMRNVATFNKQEEEQ